MKTSQSSQRGNAELKACDTECLSGRSPTLAMQISLGRAAVEKTPPWSCWRRCACCLLTISSSVSPLTQPRGIAQCEGPRGTSARRCSSSFPGLAFCSACRSQHGLLALKLTSGKEVNQKERHWLPCVLRGYLGTDRQLSCGQAAKYDACHPKTVDSCWPE